MTDPFKENEYLHAIFKHIDKPGRLPALHEIYLSLSDRQFWQCFHEVWTNTESAMFYKLYVEEMIWGNGGVSEQDSWEPSPDSLFNSSERLTTLSSGDYEFYARLPQHVTIYRGGNSACEPGISWTTDLDQAREFALHSSLPLDGVPIVWSATIDKERIVATYTARDESEILAHPALMSIASEPTEEFSRNELAQSDETALTYWLVQARSRSPVKQAETILSSVAGQGMTENQLLKYKQSMAAGIAEAQQELTRLGFQKVANQYGEALVLFEEAGIKADQ